LSPPLVLPGRAVVCDIVGSADLGAARVLAWPELEEMMGVAEANEAKAEERAATRTVGKNMIV